jgi:acyl-CoA synthetase (AMP-forming)/AMP-acid ligase II/thioesterase domain-containing protein
VRAELTNQNSDQPAALSVYDQIRLRAERQPDNPALLFQGNRPLTYGALWRQILEMAGSLNQMGIRRHDRVALVLPNGPEMLVAFLGTSAVATCAPLNPDYRAQEFEFYFKDLGVKALVVQSGWGATAREVAGALGVSIIDLTPKFDGAAGVFTLTGRNQVVSSPPAMATPDDKALMLHTSGTTSRPKMVPLSHKNICISALNIAASLRLQENDRCLDVMPLFHVHGLIGGGLSSLVSGGSVVVVPRFEVESFFLALREHRPTWYTAVPTIHQAVLAFASNNPAAATGLTLRFIRSCSAALPPSVMKTMEEIFRVPVIEAYGMTEASHQMASNPLPPGVRKTGSVGVSSGTRIAIMAEDGRFLEPGQAGEIVVRGDNVTSGYANNTEANEKSFVDGWFRTGDQGYLDPEGYLFLSGRLKELINRGGEKISPREIDEVLLLHPAVTQAATFAVPHHTLGEDVAAAIVFAPGQSATEEQIRRFVASRVAPFKVPQQIVITDTIPKGSTGKLRRLELATLLQAKLKFDFVAPKNNLEKQLAGLWSEALGVEPIGTRDNFFALGGNSLVAARLFTRINKVLGKSLPLVTLIESPTIEEMTKVLQGSKKSVVSSCLVPIRPQGRKPPFFCVHGPGGHVVNYAALAAHWDHDQPFYGLQSQSLVKDEGPLHRTVEDLAAQYVNEIRRVQPQGPYFVGGFCFGGQIAFEMAHQLRAKGETVALVALIESFVRQLPTSMASQRDSFYRNMRRIVRKVVLHLQRMPLSRPREALLYLGKRIENTSILTRLSFLRGLDRICQIFGGRLPKALELRDLTLIHYQAGRSYVTKPYAGPVALFLANETVETSASNPQETWGRLVPDIETYQLSCSHDNLLAEPNVKTLATMLRKCIDRELGRIGQAVRHQQRTNQVEQGRAHSPER